MKTPKSSRPNSHTDKNIQNPDQQRNQHQQQKPPALTQSPHANYSPSQATQPFPIYAKLGLYFVCSTLYCPLYSSSTKKSGPAIFVNGLTAIPARPVETPAFSLCGLRPQHRADVSTNVTRVFCTNARLSGRMILWLFRPGSKNG